MSKRIERYKKLIERFMNLTIADIKRHEMVEGNDFQLCSNLTTVTIQLGNIADKLPVLRDFIADNEELNSACQHVIINDLFDMVEEIYNSYRYSSTDQEFDSEEWSSEEA